MDRLRRKLSSSKALSENGVWVQVDLGDGGEPLEFLIARMGKTNRRWSSMASQSYREQQARIDAGLVSSEENLERGIRVFCTTVLLDWRGVTDANGNIIPYSVEEGVKLLLDCDLLHDYLLDEAQKISNFQDKQITDIVGKSKKLSTGS